MMLWLFGASLAHAVEQSLVYDLTLLGEPVGHRTVKITYIPPSGSDSGSRDVESLTEIDMTVAGKKISYQQHATARFSDTKTRFVSIVSINDKRFELQGKNLSNQSWIIHEIVPSGVLKKEYSAYDVEAISLALFDPGQSHKWTEGHQSIYHVEMGDVWSGEWHSAKESSISNNGVSVFGREIRYHSEQGDVEAAWSSEGILIDWNVKLMGVTLDATLRNIPEMPDFGEVNLQNSFKGVQEESL
jgi:hypothetical protein